MMDLVSEPCSNNNNVNENESGKLAKHLARIYHRIYVYVSVFAVAFGLLLYGIRQRIYGLPVSWDRVATLYALASLLALLLALACYYTFLACRQVAAQHRIQCLMKSRMAILKRFHQMEYERDQQQFQLESSE